MYIRYALFYASTTNNRRREASCFRVVRPSVRPLSVNIYFVWRDISVLSGRISVKLGNSSCEWVLLGMFSRSEVKGQGHNETKRNFRAGGIHFDGVTTRLTSFLSVFRYMPEINICIMTANIFNQEGLELSHQCKIKVA